MPRILSLETSCDETAISIVEGSKKTFRVLADTVISQIEIHKPYGGVFPMLAKREHGKNLIPLLDQALTKAELKNPTLKESTLDEKKLQKILEREPELLQAFLDFIPKIKIPKIDAIAVTHGPGLEPALWVGINFAKALSLVWGKPIIPINHMEGHIVAGLLEGAPSPSRPPMSLQKVISPSSPLADFTFPALALLISGGHTELVLMRDWFQYKIIGETRDDAVGECFDKAARVLGLPYPGGPEISKLAEEYRAKKSTLQKAPFALPRPMIKSPDFDFSFAGLKTAVLYMVQKIPNFTDDIRREICYEFEEAATDVLLHKTLRAVEKYKIKTLIIGGGVSANTHIQKSFREAKKNLPDTLLLIPEQILSTDNALMIALAAHLRLVRRKIDLKKSSTKIKAEGNLRLGKK